MTPTTQRQLCVVDARLTADSMDLRMQGKVAKGITLPAPAGTVTMTGRDSRGKVQWTKTLTTPTGQTGSGTWGPVSCPTYPPNGPCSGAFKKYGPYYLGAGPAQRTVKVTFVYTLT